MDLAPGDLTLAYLGGATMWDDSDVFLEWAFRIYATAKTPGEPIWKKLSLHLDNVPERTRETLQYLRKRQRQAVAMRSMWYRTLLLSRLPEGRMEGSRFQKGVRTRSP